LLAFPVLSTAYDDTHGMVTVMFLMIDVADVSDFVNATRWDSDWQHKPGPEWDDYAEIQVPYLSLQERHKLHGLVQPGGNFGEVPPDFVEAQEFQQYRTHYFRYPTFAPLDVL